MARRLPRPTRRVESPIRAVRRTRPQAGGCGSPALDSSWRPCRIKDIIRHELGPEQGGVMGHGQTVIVNVPARIDDPAGGAVPALDPGLERLRREVTPPVIVQDAGPNAEYAYADFFKARI